MKRIKSFKLFESYSLGIFGVNEVDTDDEYINAYAEARSGMIKSNFYKDFKNWLVYKSYERILMDNEGESYNDPTSIIKSEDSKIQSLVKYPMNYSDDGFDYEKSINEMGVTDNIKDIITRLARELKICEPAKNPNLPQVNKAVSVIIDGDINEVLDNIFWPGNMPSIKELKYLDLFGDERRENFGINNSLRESLERTCNKYASMEKDINSLGKKFMNLIKEIGDSKIESLIVIEFPQVVTEAIVEYFSKAEDSFKVADEVRKGSEHIYSKIKSLLPNIDTAADLGDLGF
jgi:hypothetical protein